MGRELKRVALDFSWPLNKTWGGYLNPFYKQCIDCPQCDGSGSSPEAKRLSDQWYGNAPFRPADRGSKPWTPQDAVVWEFAKRNCIRSETFYGGVNDTAICREAQRLCDLWNAGWSHHLNADDVAALVKAGRLHDLTQVWTREKGWLPKDPPYLPTPEEVNAWSLSGMGHDSINQWVCVKAECERLGYPTECSRCKVKALCGRLLKSNSKPRTGRKPNRQQAKATNCGKPSAKARQSLRCLHCQKNWPNGSPPARTTSGGKTTKALRENNG